MPDHPELDLLEVLLDVSSEEDSDDSSVLKIERERKRKERKKMRKLLYDPLEPEPLPKKVLESRASPEQIDSLEQLFKKGPLIEKKARNSANTIIETSDLNSI